MHTSHVCREFVKHVGPLDSHHRTHPKHPVLLVRSTHQSHATPDAVIGSNPHPVQSVRCLTLTMPDNDSEPDAQAQRSVPVIRASGECFSVRNIPATSPNFASVQYKICISFSQKRRTPLFPINSTSFSKCANTTMCVPRSAHVLAFSQSFSS